MKLVKQETSYLAERRTKEQPGGGVVMMYDELVMDEEYDILFRRLFLEAHAEILLRISSNYLANTPTDIDPIYTEFPDFNQDRDFSLWLNLHSDFPAQYRKSIDIKLQQFIVDYICCVGSDISRMTPDNYAVDETMTVVNDCW